MSGGHLSCLQGLAVGNQSVLNIHIHLSRQKISAYLGELPRIRVAGLCGNCMFNFCKKLPNCVPKCLEVFSSLPVLGEVWDALPLLTEGRPEFCLSHRLGAGPLFTQSGSRQIETLSH